MESKKLLAALLTDHGELPTHHYGIIAMNWIRQSHETPAEAYHSGQCFVLWSNSVVHQEQSWEIMGRRKVGRGLHAQESHPVQGSARIIHVIKVP